MKHFQFYVQEADLFKKRATVVTRVEGAAREPKSFPASSCNSAEAFATSNYELPCNQTCVHLHLYMHRVTLNWSKRFDAFTERQKNVATSSKKQNKKRIIMTIKWDECEWWFLNPADSQNRFGITEEGSKGIPKGPRYTQDKM